MKGKERLCMTQLIHLIRASVVRIRKDAGPIDGAYEDELGKILGTLLVGALLVRSATDVAVILGSAAELQMYPDEELFDWSMQVLGREDLHLRGVYWAVRHRCNRRSKRARRFGMPTEPCNILATPLRTKSGHFNSLPAVSA